MLLNGNKYLIMKERDMNGLKQEFILPPKFLHICL